MSSTTIAKRRAQKKLGSLNVFLDHLSLTQSTVLIEFGFHRTLLVSSSGLENAKKLVSEFKQGKIKGMTPDLWRAKKLVDSTLHPGKLCRGASKCL